MTPIKWKSDGFDQLGASRGRLCSSARLCAPVERNSTHTLRSARRRRLINAIKRHLINLSVTWPWSDIFHSWVDLAATDTVLRWHVSQSAFSATLWFIRAGSKTLGMSCANFYGALHQVLRQVVSVDFWWEISHRALECKLRKPCKWPLEDDRFLHWHCVGLNMLPNEHVHRQLPSPRMHSSSVYTIYYLLLRECIPHMSRRIGGTRTSAQRLRDDDVYVMLTVADPCSIMEAECIISFTD